MIPLGLVSSLPDPTQVILREGEGVTLRFGPPEQHEHAPLTAEEARALSALLHAARTSSESVVWCAHTGGEIGQAGRLRVGWEIRSRAPGGSWSPEDRRMLEYRILLGQQGTYLQIPQSAALENLLRLGADLLERSSPTGPTEESHAGCCPDKTLLEALFREIRPDDTDALTFLFRRLSEPTMSLLLARFVEHTRAQGGGA